MTDCDFCQETAGEQNRFNEIYRGILDSRRILDTPNFVVVPSIGQISIGHLLIVSKHHVTAAAKLPQEQLDELATLIVRLRTIVEHWLGRKAVIFEHGILADSGHGGCGIDHFHIHVVPCDRSVDLVQATTKDLQFFGIPSVQSIQVARKSARSYVYYMDQQAQHFLAVAPRLPSQYMRRILARALASDEWDWRRCTVETRLIDTYRALSCMIS